MAKRWRVMEPSSGLSPGRLPSAPESDDQVRPVARANLAQLIGNRAMGTVLNRAPSVSDVAQSSSAALPGRDRIGSLLGADLSSVRVTLGGSAAVSALAGVRAHAATLGERIVFDSADPSPAVVAHEAAHVVQQRNGSTGSRSGAEAEAHRAAAGVTAGRAMAVASAAPSGPQLLEWDEGTQPAPIQHDHGQRDDGHGNKTAGWLPQSLGDYVGLAGDYLSMANTKAMLLAGFVARPDLADAHRALLHFLDGGGAPVTIPYERFLTEDPAGQRIREHAIQAAREGAIAHSNSVLGDIGRNGGEAADHNFNIVSWPIHVGVDGGRWPGPQTENWRRAIGTHFLSITARVYVDVYPVSKTRQMLVQATLHMEDMYNFDPGDVDLGNGARLERHGLGQEYPQQATVRLPDGDYEERMP